MSDPLPLCSECYTAIESHSPQRPPASEHGLSEWSDQQFANLAVIGEAERVAAGERRLTIRHGLPADRYADRDELYDFVAGVCSQHQIRSLNMIASGGQADDEISWTRWHFDPPSAAADLAIVRAALQKRYPAWPIAGEDD